MKAGNGDKHRLIAHRDVGRGERWWCASNKGKDLEKNHFELAAVGLMYG